MLAFFIESFLLGLRNLRLHKLRSLLTALGIIIGVMAVIVMVAFGEGSKNAALEQMQQLGAKNIVIQSTLPPESDQATGRTQRRLEYGLTRSDLDRIRTLPDFRYIVPLRDTEQKVTYNAMRAPANAIGTTPDLFRVINLPLARGRYLNQIDLDQEAPVCVIGAGVAQKLFPFGDPMGEMIQVGTSGMSVAMLKIVGVLEPTGLRAGAEGGSIVSRDLDQDLYFPITLAKSRFGDTIIKREAGSMSQRTIELSEIWLQTNAIEEVEPRAAVVENMLKLRHTKADVTVKAPIQILRAAERQKQLFNIILIVIAGFSLIVGGIGIMNIMLASVTERTREIGIRRALGAKQKHITLQFLIETTVISLTGGLLGVLTGVAGATALPFVVGLFSTQVYRTDVTLWSVVGSFVVSGAIGIGFGLYPAMTAARMNPIEALRHE